MSAPGFKYLISKSNHHNKNKEGKERLQFPQSVFVEEKESERVGYCNQYTCVQWNSVTHKPIKIQCTLNSLLICIRYAHMKVKAS